MIRNKDISIHILKQEEIPMLLDLYSFPLSYERGCMLYRELSRDITYGIYDEKELVGIIQLYKRDHGIYEIGYRTKYRYMHRGYMTQGLQLLCESFQCNEIYAKVDETNIYSRKLLEHTGFLQGLNKDGVLIYRYLY